MEVDAVLCVPALRSINIQTANCLLLPEACATAEALRYPVHHLPVRRHRQGRSD